MKYNPKQVDDTVNAPESHPLKDLAVMFFGSLIILIVLYVLAGFAVDMLAPNVPAGIERSMGKIFAESFCKNELVDDSKKLNGILEKLTYYFASHPHPENRVKYLKTEIAKIELKSAD